MKKNLNIAYLNGAEGMIRRSGASSGGSGGESSGSGNGSGDQFSYYRVNINDDSYNSNKLGDSNGFLLLKGIAWNNDSIYDGYMCIAPPDVFGNRELISAVCASALPMKFKDKIINYGDWKRNFAEAIITMWPEMSIEQVLNDYKFLEPITKEEFYNLDNIVIPEE